ncbi:hypothetical protein EJA06_011505 [Pseudomonas songnenensis]|uniref:Uncharacterized protein n=1 Tax=Pseudomonas songnenensis TaxID=1176259 RepID=A0A482UJP4_9PSED|nr:hypothetical protein EJA06_011505 [Pseudomonas songnenensis]
MPDGLVFALLGESLFLVWPRKSNQKEGHPASGFCFAKLPSLRRCSGAVAKGRPCPFTPRSASCLAPPYAAPTLGLLTGNGVRVCL